MLSDLDVLLKIAGSALAVAGGLWTAGRYLRRRIVRARAWFARLEETIAQVSAIDAELRANGGGSIKDQVSRIDLRTRRTDARQSALAAAIETAAYETDHAGRCIWANPAYIELTGYGLHQLTGMGWVNVIHEDDRGRVMQEWGYALRDQRAFRSACRYMTADDGEVPIRLQANPMMDSVDQSVVGWFATVEVRS